jgi:DNA relaxase NicK
MTMKPKYTAMLDWVRFTVPVETPKDEMLPPLQPFVDTGEVLKPYPNYDSVRSMVCGRIDWHSEKPVQRKMVTLTGKDCARYREMGLTDYFLCSWLFDVPGIHITRLDLTIDTDDARLRPAALATDWSSDRFKTRARMMSEIKGKNSEGKYAGHTVYVGSRSSEQFLRVYDKAAEQGTDGVLTRMELELKGQKAFEAIAAIANNSTRAAVVAAFRRFFSWSNAGWQSIISGNTVKVEALAEPDKDGRRAWVEKVALPAVVEEYLKGNEKVTLEITRAIKRRPLVDRDAEIRVEDSVQNN